MACQLTCSSLPSHYGYSAALQTTCECYCKLFSMKSLSSQVSVTRLLALHKYKITSGLCAIIADFQIYQNSSTFFQFKYVEGRTIISMWFTEYLEASMQWMRFNEASNSLRYQCVTAERRKDSDLLWLQNLMLCSRFTQIAPVLVTCEPAGTS